MNQPLGRFVGNHLEVRECLDILQNKIPTNDPKCNRLYQETKELSLHLAAAMLYLGEVVETEEEGFKKASNVLESGLAYDKFCEVCKAQGGLLEELPPIDFYKSEIIKAEQSGYLQAFDTESIGIASIYLGAGRFKSSDSINSMAGIQIHAKIGDEIKAGDTLFTLYSDNKKDSMEKASILLQQSVQINPEPPTEKHPLISCKIIS